MKERGLSTGALAGIIVTIVVVAVVVPVTAILLLRGGNGGVLAAVPVYPGAQAAENVTEAEVRQAITSAGLPSTWFGKAYTTSESPQTVINWYKANMPGWTKVSDNTVQYPYLGTTYTIYVLTYTKGNDGAVIEAFDYAGSHVLFLLAGPTQQAQAPSGGTSGSIVGTWSGTHLGETETFTFNSNGTYSWSSGGSQQSGTWSMSGDVLTLDTTQWKVVFGTNSMQWYEKQDSGWMSTPSRSFTKTGAPG